MHNVDSPIMATTTIRVDTDTHARLVEMSKASGASLIDTVRDAAEALRRLRFAQQVTDELAELREDPEAWEEVPGRGGGERGGPMASIDDLWLIDFGHAYPGEPAAQRPALVVGPPATFGQQFPIRHCWPTDDQVSRALAPR